MTKINHEINKKINCENKQIKEIKNTTFLGLDISSSFSWKDHIDHLMFNPYPTAFTYGNGMVLHFYQQQESSTTKTVHKVINKGLKTYV